MKPVLIPWENSMGFWEKEKQIEAWPCCIELIHHIQKYTPSGNSTGPLSILQPTCRCVFGVPLEQLIFYFHVPFTHSISSPVEPSCCKGAKMARALPMTKPKAAKAMRPSQDGHSPGFVIYSFGMIMIMLYIYMHVYCICIYIYMIMIMTMIMINEGMLFILFFI